MPELSLCPDCAGMCACVRAPGPVPERMTNGPRGGGRHVLLSLLTVLIHGAPRMFQEVWTGLRQEDPACRARRAPWRNEPDRRRDRPSARWLHSRPGSASPAPGPRVLQMKRLLPAGASPGSISTSGAGGCPHPLPGLATATPSAPHTLPLQLDPITAEAACPCGSTPACSPGHAPEIGLDVWLLYLLLKTLISVMVLTLIFIHRRFLTTRPILLQFSACWRNLESVMWTSVPGLLPSPAWPIPPRGSRAMAPFAGALHGPALDGRQLDPV